MSRVVAVDLPCGPRFVEALEQLWENGDTVWPVEQHLPGPARDRAFELVAPTHIYQRDGDLRVLPHGRESEAGDALIVLTSGTSGTPKGVVLTHGAALASALATTSALGVEPESTHWVAGLPVNHIGGLSVIVRALLTRAELSTTERLTSEALLNAARSGRRVCTSAVRRQLATVDLAPCARVLLGGGPAPTELPPNVVVTYGLTESGSGVVYDGRPIPGVDVRLTPDGGIQLSGPTLARTYRDGSPVTDSSGWFTTRDLGEWTADGRLTVLGRLDDVIVTGGRKVVPEPVEDVLAALPKIAEVAVVGRPDAEWGEVVVAVVAPTAGAVPRLEELMDAVRERLPAWSVPRELVLVGAIPRTSNGKIARNRVRGLVVSPRD